MNYLFFSFVVFLIFYLISILFYKQPEIQFNFLDRKHTMILKGIGILLVIFNHLGGKFGLRYLTPLGGIGVALFLLCSGYGLFESYKTNGLKNYWKKRIVNVLSPYIIIQTIIYITRNLTDLTFIDYLKDISLIEVNHPFGWYMQFLFLWYILFYLIKKVHFISDNSALFVFYVFSLLLLFIDNGLWAEQAFSFTFGITASMFYNQLEGFMNKKALSFLFLFVGIVFLVIKQFDYVRDLDYVYMNFVQFFMKLPIALAIVLIGFQFKRVFDSKFFITMGKLSFELYLVHGYTIGILDEMSYVNIHLFLIVTIALTYVFKLFVNTTIKFINSQLLTQRLGQKSTE